MPPKRKRRTVGPEVQRLRDLVKAGDLLHPLPPPAEHSIVDLAHALAVIWGSSVEEVDTFTQSKVRRKPVERLLSMIGKGRKHVVFILCDGMGEKVMEEHLPADSFLRRHNRAATLRSTFPSTTPAVLTSISSGCWPGQHGGAGWKLRDKAPDGSTVFVDVLPAIDWASKRPLTEFSMSWRESLLRQSMLGAGLGRHRHTALVSAYAGTTFTDWIVGKDTVRTFEGATHMRPELRAASAAIPFPETKFEDLGEQKGVDDAAAFFEEACEKVVSVVSAADAHGHPTYTYVYDAHPDKHMHALGVSHSTVRDVVRAFDKSVERLWEQLKGKDVAVVVTADHGHVTVNPEDHVQVPPELLDLVEYANMGVHGTGRHAVFHCKPGKADEFSAAFRSEPHLKANFLLLATDEVVSEGLLGPSGMHDLAKERLGDFIAVSLNSKTLVRDTEAEAYGDKPQGGHGSLLPAEMRIPFVLLTSEGSG